MRPVAKRLLFATLASAPGHFFFFRNNFNNRVHAGLTVRAVAEGLLLGFPARAPGITAGFHNEDEGGALGVREFFL